MPRKYDWQSDGLGLLLQIALFNISFHQEDLLLCMLMLMYFVNLAMLLGRRWNRLVRQVSRNVAEGRRRG